MTAMRDLAKLAAVPHPEVPRGEAIERGIAASVAYLGSDAALAAIALDPYWPKWDSPWWHMLLLHELGETRRIPARAAAAMVEGVDRFLHVFPIRPDEGPAGYDPYRDVPCHCALGCVVPVLAGCGIDVDRALPWVRPWFVRYQMADGGLSCDESAYLVAGECPSSMVGTIAPFEAMLLARDLGDLPAEQAAFVDRAAGFLIARALVYGSPTVHNAAERESAPAWRLPCFPRFYFYDVLRGLDALVRWAAATGSALPWRSVSPALADLVARFPDGVVSVQRDARAGWPSIDPSGPRGARQPASSFPLLEAASRLGEPSAALTRQWSEVRRGVQRLAEAGRLVDE